ncbi:MAG TPA: hypothetical protein ENJ30_02635 [Desulfobulbaceae bacterium]|nr:hypothetical protein [Desulfobulbaceae bacterium]
MDAFMDSMWNYIMAMFHFSASLLDQVLAPLHVFGPVFILTLLAVITVLITRTLNKYIITKRYIELEKEFQYWYKIREEAMKGPDYDKAKGIAKNIDQAKLNRVYYDYFLEGFLLGLARNILPVFLMVAYINESFRSEELLRLFGKEYLFSLPATGGKELLVGSVFFYIIALVLTHLAWAVIKGIVKKKGNLPEQAIDSITSDVV